MKGFLQSFGQLFAFKKLNPLSKNSFRAVAEYCDITCAAKALENANTYIGFEVRRLHHCLTFSLLMIHNLEEYTCGSFGITLRQRSRTCSTHYT